MVISKNRARTRVQAAALILVAGSAAACKTRPETGSTVASSAAAAAFGTALCEKPLEAAKRRGNAKLLQLVMLLEHLAKSKDLAAAATYEEALKLLQDPNAKIDVAERVEKLLSEAGVRLEEVVRSDGTFNEAVAEKVAERWSQQRGTTIAEVVIRAAREEISKRPDAVLAEVDGVVERVETRIREGTAGAGLSLASSPETLFLQMIEEAAGPLLGGDPKTAKIDVAAARGLGMLYFESMARSGAEFSGTEFRARMDTMLPQTQDVFRRAFLESSAILLGSPEALERTSAERALANYATVDNITAPEAQATAVLRLGEFVGDAARPEASRVKAALALGNLEVVAGTRVVELVKPAEIETLKRLRESYERGVDPVTGGAPELMTRFRTLAEELRRNTRELDRVIREHGREVRVRPRH
jgi:hypothetical protein